MRTWTAIVAAAVFCAVARADDEPEEAPAADSKVIVLDDNNFAEIAAQHDPLLVEFYAPWCGHCKALAPKYDEAAETLSAEGLHIAKFDADAHKSVSGKHGVRSFPTLKLFRGGEFAEDYDGERTAEAIVAYVQKKAKTKATNVEVTSTSELKSIVKAKNVQQPTIVGFFADKNGVDYKIFRSVVAGLADTGIAVYHAANPTVLEGFGFFSDGSSVQMYRPNAKPFKVTYRGTLFKETLKEWVLTNAVSGVVEVTPSNQKLFDLVPRSMLRVLTASGEPDAALMAALKAIHKAEGEKLLHVGTSKLGDYTAEVEAECGKGVAVCALLTDAKAKRTYGIPEPSADGLKDFVEKFKAKKLVAKVKSEPVPAPAAKGEVTTLVGNTFNDLVINGNKNVFIKFYAPWCGHCKALAPKWDELAKELADEEDVVIAKFDMTANDLPKEHQAAFQVQGFPTIYFARKGSNAAPLKYEGGREVSDLKSYVLDKKV